MTMVTPAFVLGQEHQRGAPQVEIVHSVRQDRYETKARAVEIRCEPIDHKR